MEEFKKASCIQGFHVYQDSWTPILGERLAGNPRDHRWVWRIFFRDSHQTKKFEFKTRSKKSCHHL